MDNDANEIEVGKLQDAFEKYRKYSLHHNDVSIRTKIERELESLQNEVTSLIIQLSKSLEGNEQIEKDLKDAIQALHTVKEDCDQEIKKVQRRNERR